MKLCSFPLGTWWGSGLLRAKDTDGTIAFTDILLSQLVELISLNDDDFSAESIMTIETLLLTMFDLYWHSEEKMKNAVAELIGDKYAQHLNRLHLVGKTTIIITTIHTCIMCLTQNNWKNDLIFCDSM